MDSLSIDDLLLVNRWAQGIEEDAAIADLARDWDDRMDRFLVHVAEIADQASPSDEDIGPVLASVPFKTTRAACVILSKGVNAATMHKLRTLKGNDGWDAVWVLLHLFRVADARRRRMEGDCSHWWHRDLSDPRIVREIRKSWEEGTL